MKDCQIPTTKPGIFRCAKVFAATGAVWEVEERLCGWCTEEGLQERIVRIKKALDAAAEKGHHQGVTTAPAGKLGIPLTRKIGFFANAAARYAVGLFKNVSDAEYDERIQCCLACGSNGRTCRFCGCSLSGKWKSKARWKTEQCPNPKTYPRLPRYPARNHWGVVGELTSVLIAERNETADHVLKTVRSLRTNATGPLEIILIHDGKRTDGYDFLDEVDRIWVMDEPVGRRMAYNLAAAEAEGKYLLFIDAHCTMSRGWDTRMKYSCTKNRIVVPIIQALDDDMENTHAGTYSHAYLNNHYDAVWWTGRKPVKMEELMMTFTGCGWLIQKEMFEHLGGFDEALQEYGFTGAEWTFKIRVDTDGELILRKDVECGHVFGTNVSSKNYPVSNVGGLFFSRYIENKYGKDIMSRMEEGFPKSPRKNEEKTVNCTDTSRAIIRCTHYKKPVSINEYCLKNLKELNSGLLLVENELKKGSTRICIDTYYMQLLECLKACRGSKYVYIAEHDVLYVPERFEFVPPADDTFYFQGPVWYLSPNGFYPRPNDHGMICSGLICSRDLLAENLLGRRKAIQEGWKPVWSEPGHGDPPNLEGSPSKCEVVQIGAGILDIRHGGNYTGMRTSWQTRTDVIDNHPYWGYYKDIWAKLGRKVD